MADALGNSAAAHLPVTGEHMVTNALLAIAVGWNSAFHSPNALPASRPPG